MKVSIDHQNPSLIPDFNKPQLINVGNAVVISTGKHTTNEFSAFSFISKTILEYEKKDATIFNGTVVLTNEENV